MSAFEAIKGYDNRDGGDYDEEYYDDDSYNHGWEPKDTVLKTDLSESTLNRNIVFKCPGSRSSKYTMEMISFHGDIRKRHEIKVI